ncbi:RNA recognition motif domain protein family protein [Cryptosporidium meleagridis]|uniref:RNA recognition motif domain protein family protein n=1 Tax=Cryptosporidium meleagridis TaxID=93969 RepID=A0A2P4Z304_9CRYT|nr:RNA recognition motif domain protein family protein [Cryptosporidium meleagridis]
MSNCSRILYVSSSIICFRQLPYDISSTDLYDTFGRYGTIRQIRRGVGEDTKGTAFVVYDEIEDAKSALKQLSGFQVSGRLKLDESFIGGPLLDDFFEKIGSIFYLIIKRHETTFCDVDTNGVDISLFIDRLPKVLILIGNSGSGKKYFVRKLLSSFSKICYFENSKFFDPVTFNILIDQYFIDARANDCFDKWIYYLNNKLTSISKIGMQLRDLLCSGSFSPPAILVCFRSANTDKYCTGPNSNYHSDASKQIVTFNLISKFIRIWDDKDIPIVSFFISDIDPDDYEVSNKILKSKTMDIKYMFKYVYGEFFEIDFRNSSFQIDKNSLLRFLICKKYYINEISLNYLMEKILSIHSKYIMTLSNEELKFIVNEIDLVRISDILNNGLHDIPYTVSCGRFVAVAPNGVIPDFFNVFLHYFNFVIGRLNKSISNSNLAICDSSCDRESISCKNGLMQIIGFGEVIHKIKNLLLPCISPYPEILNFQLPIVFNEASGIIVFGDKGCGKSFLVSSISNSLNFSVKYINTADIFNATIGFLERYLKEIIDVCTRKRKFILVFEDIDQYLREETNTLPLLMFFFDIISRSNKWMHSEIMIFGTSINKHTVCTKMFQPYRFFIHLSLPGCGEWNLKEVVDMLNFYLRPLLAKFSKKMSIEVSPDKIDRLIKNVAFHIEQRFTPSVVKGIANDLGFLILKLLIESSNKSIQLNLESCFIDLVYREILNTASINALKIYVLKLSLRNAIATYEIERISSLLKIMDKKIRIIKSIKGLTYQLKNFLQYIINDKNAIQNTENQDLISLYNWLNESKLFS